jgi:Ras-related protein Rab-1A
MVKDYDFLYKLIVVGSYGVGKSSMLKSYVDHSFDHFYLSTIGVDFKIKTIKKDNKIIKLQIWDTAGQERFKSIISSYYKRSDAILLVYDITCKYSFDKIDDFVHDINQYCDQGIRHTILVGNKADLKNKREVDFHTGQCKADQLNAIFFETSAKTSQNLDDVFESVMKELCDEKQSDDAHLEDLKPSILNLKLLNKPIRKQNEVLCCQII